MTSLPAYEKWHVEKDIFLDAGSSEKTFGNAGDYQGVVASCLAGEALQNDFGNDYQE